MKKYQLLLLIPAVLASPVMGQEFVAITLDPPINEKCFVVYENNVMSVNHPHCRRLLTEAGANTLEKRVLDRNAADRKVLLDLISTLDQRIKTVEEQIALGASSKPPASFEPGVRNAAGRR